MRLLAAVGCLLLAGCGRYTDFTLPALPGTTGSYRAELSAAPVLEPGPADSWDAVDVLNPSVARNADSWINLYSGFDGKTWHTGLSTSPDGHAWQRQGKVLSPDKATWEGDYIAGNGTVLLRGGEWLYWYQAGGHTPRLGLARSRDGRQWTKLPEPVLPLGPRGSWDERGVADPYVIDVDGTLYLYYLGQDRAQRQRLGVARSGDGVHWTKLRTNPVMELGEYGAFDENGLGEPAVWPARGTYWMLYTGRNRREERRMGLARSRDGVHWERLPVVIAGNQPWNRQVVCDPTVLLEGDRVRVWFGGGDVARPDENLHGRIGELTLLPVP